MLAELEGIDDELDDIGILIVTTKETRVAGENGVGRLPALGLFRNGQFMQYERDLNDQKEILDWLTDEETLKIVGIIDEVLTVVLVTSTVPLSPAFSSGQPGNAGEHP